MHFLSHFFTQKDSGRVALVLAFAALAVGDGFCWRSRCFWQCITAFIDWIVGT